MKLTEGQKAQINAMTDVKRAVLKEKKRALTRLTKAMEAWPETDPRTMKILRHAQEVCGLVDALVEAIDDRIAAVNQDKRGETGVRKRTKTGRPGQDERSNPGLCPLFPPRDDCDPHAMGM